MEIRERRRPLHGSQKCGHMSGFTVRGCPIDVLDILPKQKSFKLPGLSESLRREFQFDIQRVKAGAYGK